MLKSIKLALIGALLLAQVPATNAACLQFPFSSGDWSSSGKTGGACRISSPFGGVRTLLGITRAHQGIDFSCKEGTQIRAVVAGVAHQTGFADGGWHVVQENSPDINAQVGAVVNISYLHNNKWAITPTQNVNPGDVVAYLGNEGHSTGAHMHLQVIAQNPKKAIDPYSLACSGWLAVPDASTSAGDNSPNSGGTGGSIIGSPSDPGATGTAAVANADLQSAPTYTTGANETPPPPPQGLGQDSDMATLYNMIGARAFNNDYITQLGTLELPSLYREFQYLEMVEARLTVLDERSSERREALRAAILTLQTRRTKAALEAQKSAAISSGNANGQ